MLLVQIYVCFIVSALLALWNIAAAAVCLRRRREIRAATRRAAYAAALLMVPGWFAYFRGFSPDAGRLLAVGWLLPVAFGLAAVQSALVVRTTRRWFSLGLVVLYNAAVALVLVLRYIEYFVGDLGLFSAGLQAAFTRVQCFTVFLLALWFQVTFYPPVLLLPKRAERPRRFPWNIFPAIPATVLIILFIVLLPHGYQYAHAWRSLKPAEVEPHSGFRTGAVVRLSAADFPSAAWQDRYVESIDDLGLGAVNIFLNADMQDNAQSRRNAAALIDRIRALDVEIILTPDYPWPAIMASRPKTVMAVAEMMEPWCLMVAEELRPDYIVPFIEPYGAAAIILPDASPEAWHEALRHMCPLIKKAAPETRCCVYFTPTDRDAALYRLCAESRVPDVLGFSFYSIDEYPKTIKERLDRTRKLVEEHGKDIEHWLFEFGHPAMTLGGETAQVNFTLLVMSHFVSLPQFSGACVFQLADVGEKLGLLTGAARPRRLYYELKHVSPTVSTGND